MPGEPIPHRLRNVGVGIGAGDQRAVPTPGAAEHEGVAVGLTAGAVPYLPQVAVLVQVQPDGREIGAVRDEIPAGGGLVSAGRAGR
ncbi:hypothetical protein [Rhodococcus jostii]|uniref:hypothetical protein n=1 Tax=Rhodococcus jostii TaxID=132919 RepID=UPI0036577B81